MTVLEHAPPRQETQTPEGPPTGLPYQEFCTNGTLQIVIASLDENVRDFALEAAHASLEETLAERGMRGLFKRIVHGNMLRGHFLLKKAAAARKEVETNNNLFHFQGIPAAAYEQPVLRRLAKDDDTYIHEDAGEYRLRIAPDNQHHQEFRGKVLGLIKAHIVGNPKVQTAEDFAQVARMLVHNYRGNEHLGQYIGRGRVQANNLWEIAQNVKALVASRSLGDPDKEQHIDAVLNEANIIVGKAHVGPHSSFNQTRLERLSQTVEGRAFINEVGAVSAVTLAYSLGGLAVQRTLGAMTAAIAPGALAGVWAGAREGRILDDERTKHFRDSAYGKEIEAKGRRKSLDRTHYEAISAVELTQKLHSSYSDGSAELNFQTSDELMKVIRTIAECDARISLSRSKNIDLITATSLANFESEHEQLAYALEKTRQDLYDWLRRTDGRTLEHLGLHAKDIKAIKHGDPGGYQEILNSVSQRYLIEEDIKDKDKMYRSLRKRRVAAMAGVAALAGASIGLAVQEGIAAINPRLEGVFERTASARQETYLAGLLHHEAVMKPVATEQIATDDTSTIPITDKLSLIVPESISVDIQEGRVNLRGPHDSALNNLEYKSDNTLSEDSLQKLKDAGFTVTASTSTIEQPTVTTKVMSAKEFVAANPDAVSASKVEFYYTNNTVGADGNESLLQYGANHGVDSKGNIVIQMGNLGKYDSTAGSNQVNPKTAASQGKLWLGLTASRDTEGQTFMLKMDSKGQAVISQDNPLASLFTKSKSGSYPTFNGHKMQVFEHGGTKKNNILMRPLATDFGTNKAQFTSNVTTPAPTPSVTYTLQYANSVSHPVSSSHQQLVNVPPILPFYTRSTLTPAGKTAEKNAKKQPVAPAKSTTEKPVSAHYPRHAQKELPAGTHAASTNIAQDYYNRIISSSGSLRKAQRQIKAILKKAGLKRRDFSFSKDGKQVYVMREATISRHVTV